MRTNAIDTKRKLLSLFFLTIGCILSVCRAGIISYTEHTRNVIIPLLSNCVFKNTTLNTKAYLITGALTLGGDKQDDKLIFGPNADYTFESHGGITLTENVEFMEGARVRFGSTDYVDLSNVTIPKNVKLTIEAPTVVKNRNTIFDDNAVINFIY